MVAEFFSVLRATNNNLQKQILTSWVFPIENIRKGPDDFWGWGFMMSNQNFGQMHGLVGDLVQLAPPLLPGSPCLFREMLQLATGLKVFLRM